MKRSFAILAFAALTMLPWAAAQSYNITDVGSLVPGGVLDVSYGDGVNSSGHVVGSSYNSALDLHAFFWTQKAGMQDLGTFGGASSIAWGVNDSQQVVGQADPADGLTHAFLWTQRNGMQDLGTLGGSESFAYAINLHGQVVGQAYLATGHPHAFLWTKGGGMQDLGTLGGTDSAAYAINNFGQVVGSSGTTDGQTRAFLWTKQTGMQDLGTIGNNGSYAYGIDDAGEVVGYAGVNQLFTNTYGFVWTNANGLQTIPFVLHSTQTFPAGMNDSHQIVGYFNNSSGIASAFVSQKGGPLQDLGTLIPANSGWFLDTASAISLNGKITGWGPVLINGNYTNHAFLLTPK
jgi:probable HAF family extracellular repeat protein